MRSSAARARRISGDARSRLPHAFALGNLCAQAPRGPEVASDSPHERRRPVGLASRFAFGNFVRSGAAERNLLALGAQLPQEAAIIRPDELLENAPLVVECEDVDKIECHPGAVGGVTALRATG